MSWLRLEPFTAAHAKKYDGLMRYVSISIGKVDISSFDLTE